VAWLSYPCSVLTLRCRSESGLVIRATGIATIRTDTAITHTDTTDLIDIMVMARRTTGTTMGTMAIEFTAITAIITTIATKVSE
jgi:hypothetical protein